MSDRKTIRALQGIRGFAIIMIILSHCEYSKNKYGESLFIWAGAMGVSLFLLLSGYLAMYRYGRTGMETTHPFARTKRKLLKVYPLHFITLLLAIPLSLSLFATERVWLAVLKLLLNLSLLQSWFPQSGVYFSFNMVSWYLSTMAFFVFLTPWIVNLLRRRKQGFLIALVGIILAVQFILAIALHDKTFAHWLLYVCPVVRCLDVIIGACGYEIAASIFTAHRWKTWNEGMHLVVIFALITLLAMSFQASKTDKLYLVACWTLPNILLICLVAAGGENSFLSRKIWGNTVLVWIGDISFELFLIHQLVLRYMTKTCEKMGWYAGLPWYLAAIAFSVFAAWIWHVWFYPKVVLRVQERMQLWKK